MTAAVRLDPLPETIEIVEAGERTPLPASLRARVDTLWNAEQARRERPLFDGALFSVDALDRSEHRLRVRGGFVAYRLWIAQLRDPALTPELAVRPLSVTGLLRVAEGLVFGRRSRDATQDPGAWELVPSGGIDASCRVVTGDGSARLDPRAQLLAELEEETGLVRSQVEAIRAGYLARTEPDDPGELLDLAFALTAAIDQAELQRVFEKHRAASARPEYTGIAVVPDAEVPAFANPGREAGQLSPLTRALLQGEGLLPVAP